MLADPLSYDAVITTPVDSIRLGILVTGDELASIDLLSMNLQTKVPIDTMSQEVVHQLQCYFEDSQRPFSLPLVSQGSDFQQRVWQFMCAIPVGETRRYGDAAIALKSAARAVGGACRRNPVPLVVPCHRIVAANGLGGFDGQRDGAELDFKQWLLNHEKQ
ncbi:Methylated-DNA--protein-cysteine methyltransferase [hydrothermal vent metagenome]|uniref:Methylated-DNA--protein-cysteine methyltransferase n=1 Tax=hydrothermal vent metagenome TaxID=652676 RepID=A0A3B0Z7D2_9ZZZZ